MLYVLRKINQIYALYMYMYRNTVKMLVTYRRVSPSPCPYGTNIYEMYMHLYNTYMFLYEIYITIYKDYMHIYNSYTTKSYITRPHMKHI